MNAIVFWRLLRDSYNGWMEDKAFRMGASLAYYSVFSMAPLLLIVIAVASQFSDEGSARGRILDEIAATVGPSAREATEKILEHTGGAGNSITATIIGIVVLLFGASGVFVELQDALNTIWKVKPKPGLGLVALIRDRLLSFAVVLGTGFLLLVSMVLSAVLHALGDWMARIMPGSPWLWHSVDTIVSFLVIAALFAMIFKILPDAKINWGDVWIGAVVTALLFTIGKAGIGAYLGQSGLASSFGAAGSVVVLLTWVYYSALILLFGAEFTHAHALLTRKDVPPTENAVAAPAPRDERAAAPAPVPEPAGRR